MKNTVELSISKKDLNCENVIKKLQKLKILASVTNNNSVIKDKNNNYMIENGCRIKFSEMNNLNKKNFSKIWEELKNEFNLGCGNLKINNSFDACIYKYINKNN